MKLSLALNARLTRQHRKPVAFCAVEARQQVQCGLIPTEWGSNVNSIPVFRLETGGTLLLRILLILLLALTNAALAARPVTVRVMVDQTMFTSTPGSQALVEQLVLQLAARLVPNLDSLKIGVICGQPQTVFQAELTRNLQPVGTALKSQVLQPCARKGSPLNAGLRWAQGREPGAVLLITDAAIANDQAASQLPATARQLGLPLVVAGSRTPDRDTFDHLLASAPNYLGTFGASSDASQALRLLLKAIRR